MERGLKRPEQLKRKRPEEGKKEDLKKKKDKTTVTQFTQNNKWRRVRIKNSFEKPRRLRKGSLTRVYHATAQRRFFFCLLECVRTCVGMRSWGSRQLPVTKKQSDTTKSNKLEAEQYLADRSCFLSLFPWDDQVMVKWLDGRDKWGARDETVSRRRTQETNCHNL